jgi:hypothetical protein
MRQGQVIGVVNCWKWTRRCTWARCAWMDFQLFSKGAVLVRQKAIHARRPSQLVLVSSWRRVDWMTTRGERLNLCYQKNLELRWGVIGYLSPLDTNKISDSNSTTTGCFGSKPSQRAHQRVQSLCQPNWSTESDIPCAPLPLLSSACPTSSSWSSQRRSVLAFRKCIKSFLGQRGPSGSSWILIVSVSPPCCVDSPTFFFAMDTLL